MVDGDFPARAAKDPLGQQYSRAPQLVLDLLGLYVNRDGCRTPMQWDRGDNAGFCGEGAKPWLPVHESHRSINVESERVDENSILNVYKGLLRLRRERVELRAGMLQLVDGPDVDGNLLAYRRERGGESVLVLINFGGTPCTFQNQTACKRILFAIGIENPVNQKMVSLPPYSGLILDISK
jgi:alpha-glucosidase